MTCAQRPLVWKCSHSQFQSSPLSETPCVPFSPRNATSKLRKLIRSGSSAERFAFSILEMRLEHMTSSTLLISIRCADVPRLDPPRILRNERETAPNFRLGPHA